MNEDTTAKPSSSYSELLDRLGLNKQVKYVIASPEEIAEQMTPPTVEYEVYNDSNHPDVKKAIYSHEDGVLRFYLPDGWDVAEVKHGSVLKGVEAGIDTFGAMEVAKINVDSANQRTCMYFTANKHMMAEDESLVRSEDYAFYNTGSSCSCAHPNKTEHAPHISAPCNFADEQQRCNIYTPQDWAPVEIVKATAGDVTEELTLESTRVGYGRPIYHMGIDGNFGDPMDTREHYDSSVSAYDSIEPVALGEETVKESFLASILSD